jgi:hypothetical protein
MTHNRKSPTPGRRKNFFDSRGEGQGVVGIREELTLLTPAEFATRAKRNTDTLEELGKMMTDVQQRRSRAMQERKALQQVCTHMKEDGTSAIVLEHETEAQTCGVCGWREEIYTIS